LAKQCGSRGRAGGPACHQEGYALDIASPHATRPRPRLALVSSTSSLRIPIGPQSVVALAVGIIEQQHHLGGPPLLCALQILSTRCSCARTGLAAGQVTAAKLREFAVLLRSKRRRFNMTPLQNDPQHLHHDENVQQFCVSHRNEMRPD
jgi:hypothetical protein